MRYIFLGLWLSLTLGYASDGLNNKENSLVRHQQSLAENNDIVIEIGELKEANSKLRSEFDEHKSVTQHQIKNLYELNDQLATKIKYLSGNPPRLTRIGTADPILLGCIGFGVACGLYRWDLVGGLYYGVMLFFIVDVLREKFLIYSTPTPIGTRPTRGTV